MTNNMISACPASGMENTYPDGDNFTCPDCSHEWSAIISKKEVIEIRFNKEAHGNIINNGDIVVSVKDLKIKGSSLVIKGGTKFKIYA